LLITIRVNQNIYSINSFLSIVTAAWYIQVEACEAKNSSLFSPQYDGLNKSNLSGVAPNKEFPCRFAAGAIA